MERNQLEQQVAEAVYQAVNHTDQPLGEAPTDDLDDAYDGARAAIAEIIKPTPDFDEPDELEVVTAVQWIDEDGKAHLAAPGLNVNESKWSQWLRETVAAGYQITHWRDDSEDRNWFPVL